MALLWMIGHWRFYFLAVPWYFRCLFHRSVMAWKSSTSLTKKRWEVGERSLSHSIWEDRPHTQRFVVFRHLTASEEKMFPTVEEGQLGYKLIAFSLTTLPTHYWNKSVLLSSESSSSLDGQMGEVLRKVTSEKQALKAIFCTQATCRTQAPLLRRVAPLASPFPQLLPCNLGQYFLYALSLLMACECFLWKGTALTWGLRKQGGAYQN